MQPEPGQANMGTPSANQDLIDARCFPLQRSSRVHGRFTGEPSPYDLARYFHLHEFDLGLISRKHGQHNRLGFAAQLGTLRYLGTFQDNPLDIPASVLQALTRQLCIESTEDVQACRAGEQRWLHAAGIRVQYGYVEITEHRIGLRLIG